MSQPFFVRSLTRSERTAICKLRRRPPNLDVYRRAQAVHLSSQGLKGPQIAEIVSCSGQWHRAKVWVSSLAGWAGERDGFVGRQGDQ